MYSKALDPKIMSTMLPPDFPADKLSQPRYGMVVEKDVMIPMRDGVMIAANIYRPDAPGTFPALHAADSYQKDMVNMVPTLPIFHCVEVNDIEYFVSRGYVFVHTDSRGTGHSPQGEWAFWSQEEQTDLYDMIEWIAVQDWCTGKVGMLGESLLAWVQWFAACQQPPHLTCILPWDAGADMYRDVAWHGGMMAVGFPTAWHMWEIRGHYRLGIPARFDTEPANPEMGRWDLVWNVINHPDLRRLLEAAQPRLLEDPGAGVHGRRAAQGGPAPARRGARLRGGPDAQEDDAHPRRHGRRRDGHLQLAGDAAADAALVRPLAQGQRHRLHGRAAGVDLRARRRRVPRARTTGRSRAPSTASCTSTRGRAARSTSR